ncbi:MAG: hypothetical protein A3A97_01190 [Candidatus Terrybacteria bacterium RIFCSPLOWO2_01_FULL_40_23]|uniref:Ribonuclease H1 N-terminal domain-containing protein n=1 Tax=Candidatus Terrybacteria bacterium RIFCSPLOWO2_01_FULL_40_23 TaxID=1802366 RepID=A0A1G2PY90_9BACT|nr:MAG: hypothetical protein A3A97_01190 [Candidatus Terrybacteria bacterium RIFCSPLOWO2_01_FULL_40_23]
MSKKNKKKYYAYSIPETGNQGITESWLECEDLVSGKQDAKFRGFKTEKEALAWLSAGADYSNKRMIDLPPGIYFDSGTGRGNGVEISVTDEKEKKLLADILPPEHINRFGNHWIFGEDVTNNYGELYACKLALELALRNPNIKKVFGDSKLVIGSWTKGHVRSGVSEKTRKLSFETKKLRDEFEKRGGKLERISGDDNPADLGFHKS